MKPIVPLMLLLLAPCVGASAFVGIDMPNEEIQLAGSWRKQGDPPCAEKYPAQLRVEPGGLYFGAADVPGTFIWWDGGTWRLIAPGRLALSVANDAVIEYAFSLEGDRLAITDEAGCEVVYVRASPE